MAEKGFGVKEVNLIGASGTPTITSPNNLNLNANNVAISTNVSIGGTLSVTGNVSIGGTLTYEDVTNIDSVGIVTARDGVVVVGKGVSIAAGGLNVTAGVSTFAGITTVTGNTLFAKQVNVSGVSTFQNASTYSFTVGGGNLVLNGNSIYGSSKIMFSGGSGGDMDYYSGGTSYSDHIFRTIQGGSIIERFRINSSAAISVATSYGTAGQVLTSNGSGSATSWSDVSITYTVTANGTSAYRFAGNGVVSTEDDPDLYLIRGQKYRFINNSGGSHPFQIREASGGTAYSTGVTNNGASSGNIDFAPTFDSPSQLVYQCTSHSGMVGNIYLRDAAGNNTNVGVTTFTGAVRQTGNPVFIAYRTSNYSLTSSAIELVYQTEKIDVGGNYNTSNGRFTAPVTGLYEFAYASIGNNNNTTYRFDLRINGSQPYSPMTLELRIDQSDNSTTNEYGTNGEYVCYVNMTAGQYASVYASSDASTTCYGSASYGYTYFRGRLIG